MTGTQAADQASVVPRGHGLRVLVAGATGGIGEGVCRELLRRGVDVVAVGRDLTRLSELAARLPPAPGRLTTVAVDVTARVATTRPALAERIGTVDGVFIAIGSAGRVSRGTVLDIPDDAARHMVEINELGGLRALQNLVPLVRRSGAVVNVLGYSAEIPFPGNPLMGSTNAAMRSLVTTLAEQVRDTGPRVYALVVGVVRTRARQAAGIDDPAWLTGDDIGAHVAALVTGGVERPDATVRYLLDPAVGPTLTPPR